MSTMRNWMLGAAITAGLGMGTATAQSFEIGVYSRGPAYIPPCPGPGYAWVAGYQSDGYWVPGRWNFVGGRDRDRYAYSNGGRGWGRDFDRNYDRDRDRNRDFDRRHDRDRDWDRDRDHDRDRDRFRR